VADGSLKGKLLVATPFLRDPNFDFSVVLVLEHNDEGAAGVVLNRPSDVEVGEPLPGWHELAAEPPVVFVGGPVGEGAAVGLARATLDLEGDAWSPVVGTVGTVDLSRAPGDVGPGLQRVRVFSGYAGWGPGQVEEEIEAGAWVIVDTHPDDAFSPDPDSLWRAVLRRQPAPTAWLSTFLADPATN
jgi:putative transcriptional regulator